MNEEHFTAADRKLLKDTYDLAKETNGSVQRHDEEIFGSEEKKTTGLKKNQSDLLLFAAQLRTAIRVVGVFIALIGVANIWLIIRAGG